MNSRTCPVLPVYQKLATISFNLVNVAIFASYDDALLLLKRTLNLAPFYFDCLYELGPVFKELENVDVVLFVVDKQVFVVVGNT